ncbi:MAG: adhesin transport system membrane fusion protein, partial [Sulfurimonas sp.]
MSHMYFEDKTWNHRLVTFPIMAFTAMFFIWSYFAEIDESVKGSGKVIPSGQTRLIQHLEGGIISHILVNEGDSVTKGQVLFRIENQSFISEKQEKKIKLISYKAKLNRLKALIENKDEPTFTKEMLENIPKIVQNEKEAFREQKNNFKSQISVLENQLGQKYSDLKELEVRFENLSLEYDLSVENIIMQEKLSKKKIISREKFLQHLSSKQKIYTKLEEVRFKKPIVEKEIKEWKNKIDGKAYDIKTKLLEESNEIQVE